MKSISWKDVERGTRVTKRREHYIAHMPDGEFIVEWTRFETDAALSKMQFMVKESQ